MQKCQEILIIYVTLQSSQFIQVRNERLADFLQYNNIVKRHILSLIPSCNNNSPFGARLPHFGGY